MQVTVQPTTQTVESETIALYTVRNQQVSFSLLSYGATITSVQTPDREGRIGEITLGFDDPARYLERHPYFGSTVGRYANRIANAQFRLGDRVYSLTPNEGANHLHGGQHNFARRPWRCTDWLDERGAHISASRFSPDGDEGYPGDLMANGVFTLGFEPSLTLTYWALTSAPTFVNLTNHTYFNLKGEGTILDHEVQVEADYYTPVRPDLIPTGEIAPVEGTPFDFRTPRRIGEQIESPHEQIQIAGGYDHNFIIRGEVGTLRPALRAYEPSTGRTLEVWTTAPGMQFYTGNKLNGTLVGRGGKPIPRWGGFCAETQHFPDTPNQPHFPSALLLPDRPYHSITVFRFGVMG